MNGKIIKYTTVYYWLGDFFHYFFPRSCFYQLCYTAHAADGYDIVSVIYSYGYIRYGYNDDGVISVSVQNVLFVL